MGTFLLCLFFFIIGGIFGFAIAALLAAASRADDFN
jgi:hypothetical protein